MDAPQHDPPVLAARTGPYQRLVSRQPRLRVASMWRRGLAKAYRQPIGKILNFDESYRGCWLVKKCDGDTRDAAYPLIPWLTFGLLIDHRLNCIMTANFAEYHVPVHADAHGIKLILPMKRPTAIRLAGETGIVGGVLAITNAVYQATAKRVRGLAITSCVGDQTDNSGSRHRLLGERLFYRSQHSHRRDRFIRFMEYDS